VSDVLSVIGTALLPVVHGRLHLGVGPSHMCHICTDTLHVRACACFASSESENASKTTTFYSHSHELWTTLDKLGFSHIVNSMPYDFSKNLGITKELRRLLFTSLLHTGSASVSACQACTCTC
jgi:hypothetical protein